LPLAAALVAVGLTAAFVAWVAPMPGARADVPGVTVNYSCPPNHNNQYDVFTANNTQNTGSPQTISGDVKEFGHDGSLLSDKPTGNIDPAKTGEVSYGTNAEANRFVVTITGKGVASDHIFACNTNGVPGITVNYSCPQNNLDFQYEVFINNTSSSAITGTIDDYDTNGNLASHRPVSLAAHTGTREQYGPPGAVENHRFVVFINPQSTVSDHVFTCAAVATTTTTVPTSTTTSSTISTGSSTTTTLAPSAGLVAPQSASQAANAVAAQPNFTG
jgi:hypothetical protein